MLDKQPLSVLQEEPEIILVSPRESQTLETAGVEKSCAPNHCLPTCRITTCQPECRIIPTCQPVCRVPGPN
jgi:hypothetical protein